VCDLFPKGIKKGDDDPGWMELEEMLKTPPTPSWSAVLLLDPGGGGLGSEGRSGSGLSCLPPYLPPFTLPSPASRLGAPGPTRSTETERLCLGLG
jgi:hypothetical protein